MPLEWQYVVLCGLENDESWNGVVAAADELGPKWNSSTQEYVGNGKITLPSASIFPSRVLVRRHW